MSWGAQRLFIYAAVAVLPLAAPHALAAPLLKTCTNEDNSADARIESCTSIIEY
jgi:hypothetical protein